MIIKILNLLHWNTYIHNKTDQQGKLSMLYSLCISVMTVTEIFESIVIIGHFESIIIVVGHLLSHLYGIGLSSLLSLTFY